MLHDVLYIVPGMYLYVQSAAATSAALCIAIPLLRQLLLFIVCRMAKNVAGSLNLIPCIVFFLFILKKDLFLMHVPLGSTVAFTASICLYYILELRACAEPNRPPARRGEAPIV